MARRPHLADYEVEEVIAEHGEANAMRQLVCCVAHACSCLLLGGGFVHPVTDSNEHCSKCSASVKITHEQMGEEQAGAWSSQEATAMSEDTLSAAWQAYSSQSIMQHRWYVHLLRAWQCLTL